MSTLNVNRIVDASGGVFAPASSVFKNRIINGDCRIDQRNAGASVTIDNTGTYTLDRWRTYISVASKFSVQQNAGSVTPPTGFTNYLGVTSLSAYTVGASEQFGFSQFVEGLNVADLGWGTADAKSVTLSFWVRSSLTGTFSGTLKNSANNRSYPYTYTINSANTWEYKTVTVAGDTTGTWLTTNGIGIRLNFSLGAGATVSGTANAWAGSNVQSATGAVSVVGTSGATFYITGVQLEVGTQATSFEYRQYQQELVLCQRYYEIVGAGACGAWRSSTGTSMGLVYKVTKRGTPTSSAYTSNVSMLEPATAVRTTTSFSIATPDAINTTGAGIDFNGFTGATAQRVAVCYTDCVAISAEL
jgi:hypothetical protein